MTKTERAAVFDVLTQLENAGRLTPDDVIAEAKNPTSPLHDYFEWNVERAALLHWRDAARTLITSFTIEVQLHRQTINVAQFVERPDKPAKDQGYVAVDRLKSNKEAAVEFLEEQLGIAETYVTKCQAYAAYLGMEMRVETVRKSIAALRSSTARRKAGEQSAQI